MLTVDFFKAGKGDSFLLTWGQQKEYNLLIDAGQEGTYRFIRPRLAMETKLDAILITHVDLDHIGGFFKLLADPDYELNGELKIFMNTPNLVLVPSGSDMVGIDHGIEFEKILHKRNLKSFPICLGKNKDNKEIINGLILQILSPPLEVINELIQQWTASTIYQRYQTEHQLQNNKVSADETTLRPIAEILAKPPKPKLWDSDLLNASSIAFIAQYLGNNILFLADANPTLICYELENLGFTKDNPIKLDLVKISHHGSKHNTTKELLERLDCTKYFISTDSSGPYYHPARETLILIANYGRLAKDIPLTIYTNYNMDLTNLLSLKEQKDLNLNFEEINYLEFPDK